MKRPPPLRRYAAFLVRDSAAALALLAFASGWFLAEVSGPTPAYLSLIFLLSNYILN